MQECEIYMATTDKETTLPITGMTCANCVGVVEKGLSKLQGVQQVEINLATEQARVIYDPAVLKTGDLKERVELTGYGVATAQVDLKITGMDCANCVATVEKALMKLDGVLEAGVNLATESALVTYVPGVVTRRDLVKQVEKAGYGVIETEGIEDMEDAEQRARQEEIRLQTRRLITGVAFTLPLFVMSMSRDFGLLGMWAHDAWVNFLFWAIATPVQFVVGWPYYEGAYKSLRNGAANMDVLVALGSSVAYFYSIIVTVGILPGQVYFETSA